MRAAVLIVVGVLLAGLARGQERAWGPYEPTHYKNQEFGKWRLICEWDRMADRYQCFLRQSWRTDGDPRVVFLDVRPELGVVVAAPPGATGAMLRVDKHPPSTSLRCYRQLCLFGRAETQRIIAQLSAGQDATVRAGRSVGSPEFGVDVKNFVAALAALLNEAGAIEAPEKLPEPDSKDPKDMEFLGRMNA